MLISRPISVWRVRMMKTDCYVPIEIIVRELDAKIYASLELLKQGHDVYFGGKEPLHRHMLKVCKNPFIYFDKGLTPAMLHFYEKIVHSRGIIVELQEECAMMVNLDKIEASHNNATMKYPSAAFTWGETPNKAIQKFIFKKYFSKLFISGYPSFDLLNPKYLEYYKTLGKKNIDIPSGYILVNTDLGHYNGQINYFDSLKKLGGRHEKVLYNEEGQKRYNGIRAYHKILFNEFVKTIKELSKRYSDNNIVVRPHPVEKESTYQDAFSDCKNVHVIRRGSVREWIANASLIMHHDCTTGVEAMIMKKPVVSFAPVYNEEYTSKLPMRVSKILKSTKELFAYIDTNYDNDSHISSYKKHLDIVKSYIHNVDVKAMDIITDTISKNKEKWFNEARRNASFFPLKYYYVNSKALLKKPFRKLFPNKKLKNYYASRFPGIDLIDVKSRIDILSKIDSSIPEIKLEVIEKNLIKMSVKNN